MKCHLCSLGLLEIVLNNKGNKFRKKKSLIELMNKEDPIQILTITSFYEGTVAEFHVSGI